MKKNYLGSNSEMYDKSFASTIWSNASRDESKKNVALLHNLDVDLQIKRTENKSQMCAVILLILSQKIWSERINQSVNFDKENRGKLVQFTHVQMCGHLIRSAN